MKLLADSLDGHVVALPQREHDEILRIGQAERVEQRLVDAIERMRGGIHREAQHLVQSGFFGRSCLRHILCHCLALGLALSAPRWSSAYRTEIYGSLSHGPNSYDAI